jgi:hypothetical protein
MTTAQFQVGPPASQMNLGQRAPRWSGAPRALATRLVQCNVFAGVGQEVLLLPSGVLPPILDSMSVVRWPCLLALALASLAGCNRAAPRPERCEELALIWHGVMSPGVRKMPQSPPIRLPADVAVSVQRMTLRCITEPFDSEFVRCINEGNPRMSCRQYFEDSRSFDR